MYIKNKIFIIIFLFLVILLYILTINIKKDHFMNNLNIICFIIIVLLYVIVINIKKENFANKINLICFLTVKPSNLFYTFIKKLPNQNNVYICIDDNKYNIPNYDNKIKIIKIDNKICENDGFHSTHSKIIGSTSREKALYYFYKNDLKYDNIWFIEEDVFIPSIYTIQNIDNKYTNEDLLSATNNIVYNYQTDWHWKMIKKRFDKIINPPFGISMICAIRCSKKLLKCIFKFALKHKTLFFCEIMFNTLALHNKLNVKQIPELSTIVWRNNWKKKEITTNNLYHPIKDIQKQYEYRKYL